MLNVQVWNAVVTTAPDRSTAADRGSADILVIDDDAIMRDLMTDWLEGAGYAVRRAGNCTAAVAELQRGTPALVVSDMWMPGPCGAEAIHHMREKHPGLKVIAVSGHFNSGQGCSVVGTIIGISSQPI